MTDPKVHGTANDLSAAVQDLYRQYHIENFEAEYHSRAVVCGAAVELVESGKFNPLVLVDQSSFDFDRFVRMVDSLHKRYRYHEYHTKSMMLRSEFISKRSDYLYPSWRKNMVGIETIGKVLDERSWLGIFQSWLDRLIAEEEPIPMSLTYEDFDGTVPTIRVGFKDVEITEDYVSARPINYWSGETKQYDAFEVRHFWDLDAKQWTPIPLVLIQGYRFDNGRTYGNSPKTR